MGLEAAITKHAVDRYVERFAPGSRTANQELRAMLPGARRLARSTDGGGAYWMLDEARGVVGVVVGGFMVTVVDVNQIRGTGAIVYAGGRVALPAKRRPPRGSRKERLLARARRERVADVDFDEDGAEP